MSNASVIQRLHSLLDRYDPRTMDAHVFEEAIEFHIGALENVDIAIVHKSRDFAHAISQSHFFDGDEEFGSHSESVAKVDDFRKFLNTLPT